MKHSRLYTLLLVFILVLGQFESYSAPSRSSSSGSRSSFSSGRSSFSSGGSKSSGWSSPSKSSPAPSTSSSKSSGFSSKDSWGSSSKAVNSSGNNSYRPSTASETALQKKAIQNGTAYKTKDEAVNKFTQSHADKYPSKYSSEPSSRPNHIPSATSYGGRNYNVVYSPLYGGYGFYDVSGAWIAYSVFRDAAMMGALMNHHGYYGTPGVVVATGYSAVGVFFMSLIVLIMFIGVFMYIFHR